MFKTNMLQHICFTNIQKASFKNQLSPKKYISFSGNDSFEKKAQETVYEKFEKWAYKNCFFHKLPSILNNRKNILGNGFHNIVYEIPNNNDFVIRFRKGQFPFSFEDESEPNVYLKDIEDYNLKRNYGQPIALIIQTRPHKEIEILKKQKGKAHGVPPASVIYDEFGRLRFGEISLHDISRKIQYSKSLKAIARFPISSYEKLLDDIIDIKQSGYSIDYENPNNFLYDEENQRINIIDLNRINTTNKNDFGNILSTIVGNKYSMIYMASAKGTINKADKDETIKNFVTVMDKFIKAMQNKNLKFDTKNYYFRELLENPLCDYFFDETDYTRRMDKLKEMGVI